MKLPLSDKIKTNRKTLIFFGVAVFFLLYIVTLYKLYETQRNIVNDIESYEKFICKGKSLVSEEKRLAQYWRNMEKRILTGETESEIGAKFQSILSDLVNKAELSVERMEEAKIRERESFKIIMSKLYVIGQSPNIVKFLYLVESHRSPSLFIKDLTIKKRTYFGRRKSLLRVYITVAAPVKFKEK